jgi:hypothetical protein
MASLDPLDRELFQRAFDAARSVINADELDSDEKLEAAWRCELLTIALLNGMSDPERYLETVLLDFQSEIRSRCEHLLGAFRSFPRA